LRDLFARENCSKPGVLLIEELGLTMFFSERMADMLSAVPNLGFVEAGEFSGSA
jgi:saccharopine dehydrogenase-like NADP-dependent oxidoreductase